MITILRGERAADVVNALAGHADAIVLRAAGDSRTPVPWGALRSFIAQGRAALNAERVARAVLPHHAMLSLALRGLVPFLDESEQRYRAASGGIALAELPNAILRDAAMYRAWQSAMGDLFAGERIMIVVPDLDAIDLESLRAMRPILRTLRDRADLRVVIGHDPANVPADPVDAFFRARRDVELSRLEALPITRVEPVTETAAPSDATAQGVRDPLDDGLESRAYVALAAHGASDPNTRVLASIALLAAFDAFALEPAFRLAEALLATVGTEDECTRDAIRLGALALYNLAPLAKEPWISATLVDRFTRLIQSEPDPLSRAHWNYRLALVQTRGRNALEAARAAGDAAVADAEGTTGDPRAPLFAAWARNGRAFVRARASDFEGAAADTEAGHAALAGGARGVPEIEVRVARLFIANNRARVAQFAGDDAALAKWRAIRTDHFNELPVDERPGPLWLPVPGGHRDLAAQRDHHAAVLADARDRLDVDDEAIAAHGLGVTLYKLGDASGALGAFATSLRIWPVIGGFAEDVLTEELNTAVSAFRAGETLRAAEGFARVRQALAQDAAAQAETLAALAMIDARAGERERAIARADEAICAAEAVGAPDVFVRTLRSAAEAFLILGDRRNATEILERALAAIASAERDGIEIPAEDVLGVLVARLDAGQEQDTSRLHRALKLAPLVVDDANAWWDLPRLAAHVRAHPALEREETLAEGLATVAMVVDQREDAKARIATEQG
jgi:tetratricopeptide (TPR) repeat protein